MGVIEPGQIGLLVGQSRLPIIVPDFASRYGVEFVDPFGSFFVQLAEHTRKILRCIRIGRRMTDEVVVIRKHRLCFELPTEFRRDFEQAASRDANNRAPIERPALLTQ